MRSGTLRHRVEIQAKTTSQNSLRQTRETWATVRTVWASWATPSAREVFAEGQLTARASHVFGMRRPGLTLTAQHRLKIGTRIFNIAGVYEGANRGREVVVTCTEPDAQGA